MKCHGISFFYTVLTLIGFAAAKVAHIKSSKQFEDLVIDSPHVWLGLFVDLGNDSEEDLSAFDDAFGLDSVKVALIDYHAKEVSLEYNVRRRKPRPGKWKAFLFSTRSRSADEVKDYDGKEELAQKVNELTSGMPKDGIYFLKTTLALGGDMEEF